MHWRLFLMLGSLAMATGPAGAAPPWRPQVTVEASRWPPARLQRRAPPRARLSETARRELDQVLAEGRLWLARGRYRRASERFSRALEIDPGNHQARLDRARVLLCLGYLRWNLPAVRQAAEDLQRVLQQVTGQGAEARLLELARNLQRRIEKTARWRAASRARRRSGTRSPRPRRSPGEGKPGK